MDHRSSLVAALAAYCRARSILEPHESQHIADSAQEMIGRPRRLSSQAGCANGIAEDDLAGFLTAVAPMLSPEAQRTLHTALTNSGMTDAAMALWSQMAFLEVVKETQETQRPTACGNR